MISFPVCLASQQGPLETEICFIATCSSKAAVVSDNKETMAVLLLSLVLSRTENWNTCNAKTLTGLELRMGVILFAVLCVRVDFVESFHKLKNTLRYFAKAFIALLFTGNAQAFLHCQDKTGQISLPCLGYLALDKVFSWWRRNESPTASGFAYDGSAETIKFFYEFPAFEDRACPLDVDTGPWRNEKTVQIPKVVSGLWFV